MAALRWCVTRLALPSTLSRQLPALAMMPTSATPTSASLPHLPHLHARQKSDGKKTRSKASGGKKQASGERYTEHVEPFSTKDYGSGPSETARRNGVRLQIIAGSATALLGALYILYRQLTAKEKKEEEEEEKGAPEEECAIEEDGEEKKKRISFHDRRVIEYENRIRAYSTPDKIFRYFATIKLKEKGEEGQIYMTPDDFLRSITPGEIQPADYGLDQFRTLNMESLEKQKAKLLKVPVNSVFASLGCHGLISFSDYLFLLTILATPTRHFEIAFKMFDLNGDGEVDCEEFQTVQGVILNSTAVGARHRDHSTTGSVAGSVGDGLVEKFFGKNGDQRLTVDKFKDFHMQLLEEVMKLEFDRYDHVHGKIAELDFARLILSYASMNDQRRKKFFKRVKKKYGSSFRTCEEGVSFEEVKSFARLVDSIVDVEMALSMHSAAGASITADDLKTVSRVVAGVDLNDRLLEFIITLFDEDGDGDLSHEEFIKVMKSRTTRGLEKSKELGISRLMGAVMACSVKTLKDQLGLKS